MFRFLALLLAVSLCAPAQAPAPATPAAAPAPEVERLNSLIEELTALKGQVAQTESKIESLLQALSEQRGALTNKPTFNAISSVEPSQPPDVKKILVRCRAFTSAGKRCTRAAMEGSKYCKQHALAHQR